MNKIIKSLLGITKGISETVVFIFLILQVLNKIDWSLTWLLSPAWIQLILIAIGIIVDLSIKRADK